MHLETQRLILRHAEAAEVDAVAALWSDAEVMQYMGGPRDAERVRRHVLEEIQSQDEDTELTKPVILLKTDGRLIGNCMLLEKEIEGKVETELVYLLTKDVWSQGFASEAAGALRDYGFYSLGLRRLVALIEPENIPSIRVAEIVGMTHERDVTRPGGRIMHLYSINRSDGTEDK